MAAAARDVPVSTTVTRPASPAEVTSRPAIIQEWIQARRRRSAWIAGSAVSGGPS